MNLLVHEESKEIKKETKTHKAVNMHMVNQVLEMEKWNCEQRHSFKKLCQKYLFMCQSDVNYNGVYWTAMLGFIYLFALMAKV